jgi:magnesium transporter
LKDAPRTTRTACTSSAPAAAARLPPPTTPLGRRHACTTCAAATSRTTRYRRDPTLHAALFGGFTALLPKALTPKQRGAPAASPKTLDLTPVGGNPRYASSGRTPGGDCNKPTWQEWLFGPDPKKEGEPLKDGDIGVLLEDESGSIFRRRSLTAKAALDPRLRCTEVDGNGKVVMVDGELKKSELIAKVRHASAGLDLPRASPPLLTLALDSMASSRAISARSTRPTSRTSSSAPRPS